MEIIKDAFVEGRKTKTDWKNSKAKKDSIRLEAALDHTLGMSVREYMAPIPLHQVCPDTGKILNTFPSRIAAARYIVSDILKRPDKNPVSITGNMEMCMRGGWKSYGYYWKMATPESIKSNTTSSANSIKVWVTQGSFSTVYPSIQVAADSIGIGVKAIKSAMKENGSRAYLPKNMIIQEYQPKLRTLAFKNVKEAAEYANCSPSTMCRWVKSGVAINNTIYTTKTLMSHVKKPVPKYSIFKNRKKIAQVDTTAQIAAIVGGHRTTVAKKIKKNSKLGEFGQYHVKVAS